MWWKKRAYFDYASGMSGNPSSPHEEGRRARKVLEDARTSIARLIEVQSDDIIFTSGATESNALAILGLPKKGEHVLYLPSAHASIVENVKLLQERGVNTEPLVVTNGQIDTNALKKRIRPETALVTVEAVCGETGIVWNTREVKNVIGKILLHVDASQAPLTEKLTRAHFSADLLTLDASKVGITRGIGVLVAHRTPPAGGSLTPLYRGGGQERGLRPGSEAPELARSFACALRAVASGREAFRASAERERTCLIEGITRTIPNVQVNESRAQAPHILNLSFLGRDTDYLVTLLDETGFAVSTRSACETDSQTGSRAVYALTGDHARARATLRISWGPHVHTRDFSRFARALTYAVAFIDSRDQW